MTLEAVVDARHLARVTTTSQTCAWYRGASQSRRCASRLLQVVDQPQHSVASIRDQTGAELRSCVGRVQAQIGRVTRSRPEGSVRVMAQQASHRDRIYDRSGGLGSCSATTGAEPLDVAAPAIRLADGLGNLFVVVVEVGKQTPLRTAIRQLNDA